ncbi:restriction endonuclease [Acidihalobacter prosperus]|uniref:restriction endonuclease n=1 Tax=Acidihalobacter prosperus TaxID=160660 RepID=UPI00050264B9|nr:restriction endonuclease [Acidihalobacter prosperus]
MTLSILHPPAFRPGDDMRVGHSGLEIRGRGTWHQIDAFALWPHSPAFMYPLRLIVEAKCYKVHQPVGVGVPRNAVGVLKDISENYFTYRRHGQEFQGPRYNYTAAIFSTSGFTRGAIEYAIAHQIFLIQYENVPVIRPLVEAIRRFDEGCISVRGQGTISAARNYYRDLLAGREPADSGTNRLSEEGIELLRGSITEACRAIGGSYFGMLQGRWPMHLLRSEPLPSSAFENDIVMCSVNGNNRGEWTFVPLDVSRGSARWFELEFSLPSVMADLVAENWDNPIAVANIKQDFFSYIDLSGVIGGIRRNVRLKLDRDWIRRYVSLSAEI